RQQRGLPIGWHTRRKLRRRAESLLNPEVSLDQLHDVLAAAHEQRVAWTAWSGSEELPKVPASLDESRRLWSDLEADLRWLAERLGTTAEGGDLFGIGVDELIARIDTLAERKDRIAVLPRVSTALDRCLAAGFDDVITDLATRAVPSAQIPAEVERIWWRSLLTHIAEEDPRIGKHDGQRLRSLVDEFVRLDLDHLRASRDEVRMGVAHRLHDAANTHTRAQEIARYAASGTGAGVPALELFAQTADLLLDVKPCWAMSPQVVASLIPPGEWFDVVIVDDASQMLVAHAVSAVSRGRQVVVVGDDKLPFPAPYTTAAVESVEEADPDEHVLLGAGPTLLDVATGVLPTRRLTTVHRAVDESLLGFVNHSVHDGALVTTPGTGTERSLQLVVAGREQEADGTADLSEPGDSGDVTLEAPALEDAEAATVVDLVREHVRERPDESLLVVTLSSVRADEIRAAIDTAAELDGSLRAWASTTASDADRVVHIDRVIGAERDAVILVLGYHVQPDGSLPRRFGRLDADGGDRVLAAALGIARTRATVVTEVSPDDFGDRRPATSGAVLVRDLLRHIESHRPDASVADEEGSADPAAVPEATPSPVVLTGLAKALTDDGLRVYHRHGTGSRRLDLAVGEGQNRPVVAVQPDGPEHAAVADIRDRERVRADLLRRLGWEVVRVWSADLADDPAATVPLVREALRAVDARAVLRGRRDAARRSRS
ncbi:MAG: hypothetical protein Q4G43_08255, partial [Mobilicoccus sp.]|nr:hypothetical protein [Mobilicoccus sp.]